MSITDLGTLDLDNLHALKAMVGDAGRARIEVEITKRTGPGGNPAAVKLPKRSSVPLELQREKDVEQDIDSELIRLGFDVTRFSQPRKTMQTEGIPDRYACHVARKIRLWIEVKQPGGGVSPDQKRWHRTERSSGGDIIVVWSIQDLHDELRARGIEITHADSREVRNR